MADHDDALPGEYVAFIDGRPDFQTRGFGITRATPRAEYVFTKRGMLVHRIKYMELHWYDVVDRKKLGRRRSPRISYQTVCGVSLHATSYTEQPSMCARVAPDAELCRSCLGQGRNFKRRNRKVSLSGRTIEELRAAKRCIREAD